GSCYDCIQGGSFYIQTIHQAFCCVTNPAVIDDPVKSISRTVSDCPEQNALFAGAYWVLFLLVVLSALMVVIIIWCRKKSWRVMRQPEQTESGGEELALVSYTGMGESVDSSFMSEPEYEQVPETRHEGLCTYENVLLE
ncbi:unnamed protein product, partial [Allacma fusca]